MGGQRALRAVTSSALTKVTSPMNSIGLKKMEFGEGQKERGREAKKGGRTEDESGPSLVRTNLGRLRGGPTLPPPPENSGPDENCAQSTLSEIRKPTF